MPKTEDVRAAFTKSILRDAISALLQSHDFETITINEICRAAVISRSTFYNHYEDKYDLMVDYMSHIIFSPQMTLDMDLEVYFEHILSVLDDHHEVISRLTKISDTMELKWKMDNMFHMQFFEYFNKKYPDGSKRDVPVEILASYHCHGIMQVCMMWIKKHNSATKKALAKYLAEQLRQA